MPMSAPAVSPRVIPFAGVVAIDGPSGTGKSTVARRLARALRARYLDTGAMYRAAAVGALVRGVDLGDPEAVAVAVAGMTIAISTDAAPAQVLLNGEDVTQVIRTPAATAAVTPVSAIPAVRRQLVARQQELIGRGRIVVEGRDIGSVVWPTADLKVYLTARAEIRASRRAGETAGDVRAVQRDLDRRDLADSTRAVGPLLLAVGAIEVDTSDLDADGVVAQLLELVAGRRPARRG